MQFRILRHLQSRPSDSADLLGMSSYSRESHGGRSEAQFIIFISHSPELFDDFSSISSGIFVDLGSGDGTPGVVIAALFRSINHSILIENDPDRTNNCERWIAGVHIYGCVIELHPCSYLLPWRFFDNHPLHSICAFYLNNYNGCLTPETSNDLAAMVEEHAGVGSVVVCLDIFFLLQPNWTCEVFSIVGIPRGHLSWLCRDSHSSHIYNEVYVYKYTKGLLSNRRGSNQRTINMAATRLSYSDFWNMHQCI